MSLIFATQLTAAATAALAVFAIVTAAFAFLAYRKQALEVGILQRQMKEQQDAVAREAAERRRAQAARVFTGRLHGVTGGPYAKNGSDLPVYDAQFWYSEPGELSGPSDPYDLGQIPPGEPASTSRLLADGALAHTILTFRDAAGIRWIRMPDGALEEQTRPTAQESVLAALGQPLPEVPGVR